MMAVSRGSTEVGFGAVGTEVVGIEVGIGAVGTEVGPGVGIEVGPEVQVGTEPGVGSVVGGNPERCCRTQDSAVGIMFL